MAQKITRFLAGNVTQGVADAYAQVAIATGIIPELGMAYLIQAIEIVFNDIMTQANGAFREWAISRDTKAAMPLFSDPDVIYYDKDATTMVTSGAVYNPSARKFVPMTDGVIIVEPNIYLCVDSATTSITNKFYARVYYEEVKLSEVEILRLLQNQ